MVIEFVEVCLVNYIIEIVVVFKIDMFKLLLKKKDLVMFFGIIFESISCKFVLFEC